MTRHDIYKDNGWASFPFDLFCPLYTARYKQSSISICNISQRTHKTLFEDIENYIKAKIKWEIYFQIFISKTHTHGSKKEPWSSQFPQTSGTLCEHPHKILQSSVQPLHLYTEKGVKQVKQDIYVLKYNTTSSQFQLSL